LVRQVARLLPGGEWFNRVTETFAAIQDVSNSEITADTARQAVDFLLHGLPESERERVSGFVVQDLENRYEAAGEPPPPWLDLLKGFFATGENPDP
jgi:hypothetical protein